MIRRLARRLAMRAESLFRGRGLILLYHRVADEPSDPYGLCVPPQAFEAQLQALRELGEPMHLADMVRLLREGSLPDRAIALTFDDAYLDVLEAGVPLLRRYDLPATVFVTTGSAGREREFWWDELERVLLTPPQLPTTLELEIGGRARSWQLGVDARLDPVRQRSAGGWHLLDQEVPTRRHAAFAELYHLVRPLAEDERADVMDALAAWAGDGARGVRTSRRVLSAAEVAKMSEGGLVEVGAHSVTHPDLTATPANGQRDEMRRSKADLEEWTGGPIRSFAYPYGHCNRTVAAEARAAGFEFACAGEYMPVRAGTDPFLLPRVDVPPGGEPALRELVRRYLG